jgi:hypothetical protein
MDKASIKMVLVQKLSLQLWHEDNDHFVLGDFLLQEHPLNLLQIFPHVGSLKNSIITVFTKAANVHADELIIRANYDHKYCRKLD